MIALPRPPKPANRPPASRGFTMIEIVVVLAIVVLLSMFTVGAYLRMQQAQKISVLADRVVGNLQSARSLAINNSRKYSLLAELTATSVGIYQITVVDDKEFLASPTTAQRREYYPIEKRYKVTVAGNNLFNVTFFPDGTASGTTQIVVTDPVGNKSRVIEVFQGGMIRQNKSLGTY